MTRAAAHNDCWGHDHIEHPGGSWGSNMTLQELLNQILNSGFCFEMFQTSRTKTRADVKRTVSCIMVLEIKGILQVDFLLVLMCYI